MAWRELFTKDPGWKLLSGGLAVAIWLTVHTISEEAAKRRNPANGLATRTFQAVPVQVVSGTADVREFKTKPPTVQINVAGKPDTLNALDPHEVRAFVHLSGNEFARDLKMRVEVSLPPGPTLVNAMPQEVEVVAPPRKGR